MALNARIGLDLADFKKSISQIEKDMSGLSLTLKGIGTAITGALSVGAVTAAVGSFLDLTGSLTDLSAKTGISTAELQKLKFAAEQNGGTIEGVTGAIGKMGKALVEGKDSTVEAMKRLGLSIKDVRTMEPGQAFATIADKIATIESPMERSTLAMELFGKSGADLLPMLTGNLSETMDAAEKLGIVLDDETVAAGDNLGDTLGALQAIGGALIGKVLAPMLPAFQMVADAMMGAGSIVDYLRTMFDALARMVLIAIKGIVDGAVQIGQFASKIPGLNKLLGDEAGALQAARDASVWLGGAIQGLEQQTTVATVTTNTHRTAVGLMTEEDKKALKVKKEKTQLTSEEVQVLRLLEEATKRAAAEAKYQEEVGRKQLDALGNFAKNLPTAIFSTRSFAGSITMVSEEAAKFQGNLAGITKTTGLAEKIFGTAADFGKNLASTIMGAIQGGGNPVAAAAGMVGASITTHIAKTLTDEGSKLFNTAFGGMINAILPGIGGLLAPLVGKIASVFDRNKGRDIVEEFAKGFGGFDALHAELLKVGGAGEQQWIALTQRVGRNDQEGARAAVAATIKLLEEHKNKQVEVGKAAEESSAAQLSAQLKVKDGIAALDNEMASLLKLIENEAPEEHMGIVEQLTRERIAAIAKERDAASKALEDMGQSMVDSLDGVRDAIQDLPREIELHLRTRFDYGGGSGGGSADSVTASFAGGTGGRFLDFGTGTLAMLHGRERVVTESEGARGGGSSAELRAVRMVQERTERLLRDLPRAMAIAVQDRFVLSGM